MNIIVIPGRVPIFIPGGIHGGGGPMCWTVPQGCSTPQIVAMWILAGLGIVLGIALLGIFIKVSIELWKTRK